jgi:tetratricopeptide (TPR) repeat protein
MSNPLFEEANLQYKEGRYSEALAIYTELVESGLEHENLYYNLGNTAYKSNQIALSIWAYEKALKIKPADKDIKHNLQLANLKIKDRVVATPKFFIVEWFSSLSLVLSSNRWALISILSVFFAIVSLLFYLFSSNLLFRKSGFYKFVIFIFIAFLTLIFAKVTSKQPLEAIVFAYSTTAKSEPLLSSSDLFIIHEGIKVRVVDEDDNWMLIELPNEMKGWIKKSDLRIL